MIMKLISLLLVRPPFTVRQNQNQNWPKRPLPYKRVHTHSKTKVKIPFHEERDTSLMWSILSTFQMSKIEVRF